MSAVKGGMTSRQAKAAQTRSRIVQAAHELFCAQGFKATTMEAIGERAGVAVQTVYFAFRTKDELLRSVHAWAILGDDPTPPPLQAWNIAALQEPDGRVALAKIVAGTATLNARVAPLIPVLHAVSQDPAGEFHQHSETLRRQDLAALVTVLARKTPLAPGMTRRRATDLVFMLMSAENYRAFVIGAGWPQREWVRWVSDTLCRDLFGTQARPGPTN